MRIRVLFFGQLKDIIGRPEETLELPSGSQLASVLSHYSERFSGFEALMNSIACSRNQEYAAARTLLHEGDEIGLLPPVSGGSTMAGKNTDKKTEELRSQHCAIVRHEIDIRSMRQELDHPENGSIIVFEGVVRNNSRGKQTLYLDYEAYESMALNEMQKLAQASLERFRVRDVRIVHRLGRLEIGEASIAIAVASAHRAAGFDASRWLIDTLKKTVPIWKKEYFQDGAVWADGEPFPDEVKAQE